MSQQGKVMHAVEKAISAHGAFGDLLDGQEKQYLMDHGVVRSAAPDEVLCRRQQLDTRVYILVLGEVEVSDTVDGKHIVLARLGPGEVFGEISALFRIPRISDVTVSQPSVLIEIPGDVLEQVLSARPELQLAIIQRYKNRLTETALRSVLPLRDLSHDRIASLIERSTLVGIPPGGVIVSEEETGDALYIIIYGTARVSHEVNGERLNIALLRAGDYFGEWSLLTGLPRTASVEAVTRVEALRVDCAPFQEFIRQNPDVRERIDEVAHNRHSDLKGMASLDGATISTELSQLETLLGNPDN
ncbi:MAG: cyclic nucleotide-binding domain-containing protein [Halobacteria archaeon]|nr:cyclic nucleotide-binding domain-containing protein [Halobacteria archaeon]